MANNASVPSIEKQQINRAMHFGIYFTKKITPLKGPFKCDVPRWGYHGGGVYGSAQINVTKVYGANVISVTTCGSSQLSRKRC